MRQPLPRQRCSLLAENPLSESLSDLLQAEAVEFPPSGIGVTDHRSSSNGNSSWYGSASRFGQRWLDRALERRLARPLATSCLVSEPLPGCAAKCCIGAGEIIPAEPFAMVVPEIELGRVAMQMRCAHMEITAIDAAFEDGEEVLDRVGVPELCADIFLGRMVDRAVASELRAAYCVVPGSSISSYNLTFAV